MSRYIDANDLIDFIDVGHLRHPSELCFSEIDVVNLLLHAPTYDVAPVVHGHYVFDDDGDSSCSVCREKYLDHTQKYCPNCGAKLDGEDGDS